MNDVFAKNEKAKEKILDVLFEYAAACHVENIANELSQYDDMPEKIPFPVELDKRIRILIAQYRRKAKVKAIWETTKKVFLKASVTFTAIIIIFTISVISSDALRVKVLNFFIQMVQYIKME